MSAQTLPDEVDFVFCPEALPEDGMHRIVIVVDGMSGSIPTALFTLDGEEARSLCDRLNRRLGHLARASWTAFAERCLRGGAPHTPTRG